MYNEELVIGHLRGALEAFLPTILCPIEIILINDGSRDATLDHLIAWSQSDSRVRVIHLSRNFGHQIAVTAGLDYAAGEVIVILDADLQDPLAVIPKMIERYMEGYDVVYGQRATRAGESSMKKFSAWLFYRIMQTFVDPRLPADTGDFRLVSRTCLDALKLMRETHRFLRGMIAWVGYPQIAVTYDRQPRVAGTTKYPLRKMLSFSWTASTSFSTVPIRIAGLIGILVGAIGLEEVGRTLFFRFMGWYTVPGWASLMVATCLIGSAILISIAIVGEYLGKVYEQAKDRPLYLVARTFGYSADG
jgi:dolichol-phosphate mannosyltransferase